MTILTVFVGILVFKYVDFVAKAQASKMNLSTLQIENANNNDEITFYIYGNDKVLGAFEKNDYTDYQFFRQAFLFEKKLGDDK